MRISASRRRRILPTASRCLALVGATAQWLIVRGDVVSVTVSAADALIDSDSEATLRQLWHETAKALRLSGPMPPARLIKEKRATFRQTPAAERLRPPAAHRAPQPVPRRRLDRDRPAGDDRGRDPVRPCGRRRWRGVESLGAWRQVNCGHKISWYAKGLGTTSGTADAVADGSKGE